MNLTLLRNEFAHLMRCRDLKSSNVLLAGGGGTAKIGDMGLGKLLESDETSLQVCGNVHRVEQPDRCQRQRRW